MHRITQYQAIVCLVLTLAACGLLFGCGRKGPPVPRKAIIPPPIQDLKGEIREDRLLLTWSVPKQNSVPFGGIKRFAVLGHTEQDSTPPCPGCPLSFKEVDEVLLANPAPARIEAGRVHYSMRFDPEFRYAFKVITYHKSGGVSDDSNIVRLSTK
jgi:hypothetical protein